MPFCHFLSTVTAYTTHLLMSSLYIIYTHTADWRSSTIFTMQYNKYFFHHIIKEENSLTFWFVHILQHTRSFILPKNCLKVASFEFFHLLGYYAVRDGLKTMFQDSLLVPSSRVKLSKKKTAWTLKIGPIGSPKMLVLNLMTQHNNPKDGRIQFKCCESLRTRTLASFAF